MGGGSVSVWPAWFGDCAAAYIHGRAWCTNTALAEYRSVEELRFPVDAVPDGLRYAGAVFIYRKHFLPLFQLPVFTLRWIFGTVEKRKRMNVRVVSRWFFDQERQPSFRKTVK